MLNPIVWMVRTRNRGSWRRRRSACGSGLLLDQDVEILRRAATGDSGAVAACIDRFGPLVSALARQILMNPSEHDDAVQEVFIEIWKHAARFDPSVASARTFVAVIARRRLIDRGRSEQSRKRAVVRLDGLMSGGTSSGQRDGRSNGAGDGEGPVALATRETLDTAVATVRREVEALRPAEQEALRMAFGLGWSHQRISEYTRQPLGTVKTTIRRALMRLRETITQQRTMASEGGEA